MKASNPLLLFSVAANVALGGVYLWRTTSQATVTPAVEKVVARDPAPLRPSVSVTPSRETWKQLAAVDDMEFVARLRTAGFPPGMIFALVKLRVVDRYGEAVKKFRLPVDYAYWRKEELQGNLSPEDRIEQRRLVLQMIDELRQLLPGNSYVDSFLGGNPQQRYGRLSSNKIDRLDAINKDYNDLANMVRARANGLMMQEDRDQITVIEQERRADLAKLLTAQELREYYLRSSPSAQTVRTRLRYFDATEDEFRAMTDLQLAFDATYGDGYNLNGEQKDRREAAIAGRDAQIEALLSPERLQEYEIKTDPSYSFINGLVSQFNPTADPSAAVGTEIDLARRFNALRANHDLSSDIRDAQLDMLSVEANNRMTAALGPEAFNVFKRNGGPINALLNRPAHKP